MKNLIKSFALTILLLVFSACNTKSGDQSVEISIIPKPINLKTQIGQFSFSNSTEIVSDNDLALTAINFLMEKLNLEDSKIKDSANKLKFVVDENLNTEGEYKISVNNERIKISANDKYGFYYGVQTLLQLMPVEVYKAGYTLKNEITIPAVEISDYPRFKYRGMHLDVCRHFMPVEFVKKYIDYIAMHKMNKFHWHLTEDQGWRIEIKKYPKLKEISAFRNGTIIGHLSDEPKQYDSVRHGGIYTQEQIREVVKYAESRCVEIIPEIELPGHSVAALAAYPEFACTEGPFEVEKEWGVFDDVYCAGKEKTFKFLTDVLSEVIELFPSEYVHIGGDECPKTRWKECPDCQKRIKDEKLKDEHELQSYFIKRIQKFLSSKNKKLIGWDEILEGGLAPDATVMSWRGTEGGIYAANQNHNVIMTPYSHVYFDYYQADKETEPLAIGGDLPLQKVYHYEPLPEELPEEKHKYILGAQANVWTEYMKTPEHVEYMVFPRMDAISEVVWTKRELKNYEDFLKRLEKQMKRYEKMGINYSRAHLKAEN